MTPLTIISVCITINLGLITMFGMVVNAWVKASRVDKLESHVDKLWEKITEIMILRSEVEACKQGISEIKDLLKEERNR